MIDIPGFEGSYCINELGEVWSIPREIKAWNRFADITYKSTFKKLKPGLTNSGYHQVQLRKNGKTFNKSIHRLMGITFLNISKDLDINHIDGNKTNNALSNLELCTRSENLKHAYSIGLLRDLNGENHPTCKTPSVMQKEIEKDIENKISYKEVCRKYGIKRTTFYSIKNKQHWWYRSQK